MRYFLVDYENVHTNGLRGVTLLSESDSVIIFYSENADTMTFGLHRRLNASKADISFQKVQTGGKNALDFQLFSYLGYLIGKNESQPAAYRIVSNDQGYATPASYWKRHKADILVIPDIIACFTSAKQEPPLETSDLETQLSHLLPEPYKDKTREIAETLGRCKTKQEARGELLKALCEDGDISVASEIYQLISPLLGNMLSSSSDSVSEKEPPLSGKALKAQLKALLPAAHLEKLNAVAEIVERFQTKQKVHGELVRIFHEGADNSVAREIYQSVKPLLSDAQN